MPKYPKLAQRSDGRYYVRYKGKCFYGKTCAEAYKKRDDYIAQEREGLNLSTSLTVGDYAAKWLPIHKASVSDKCYNDYAKQIDKMSDCIGHKLISDVKPTDIKQVYSECFVGMSTSTIHRAKMIYTAIFNSAVEDGLIRINPCKATSAQPHKGTAGTHRTITQEQRTLIENTPHRFRLSAMVMLYAGLRRGECLALDADKDIDLQQSRIYIRRAIRFDSNQPIMASPKTDAGTRSVPILSKLHEQLKDVHGLIMSDTHGKPCTQIAFRRGWNSYMHTLTVAAGHQISIRPHDLRHSFCTMCRDSGVDMHLLMKWMGHSDQKMILQIYDHVSSVREDAAVSSIESNMGILESQRVKKRVKRR